MNLFRIQPSCSIVKRCLQVARPSFTFVRTEENKVQIFPTPERWPKRNFLKYYPQSPDEPIRRAVYYHCRYELLILYLYQLPT